MHCKQLVLCALHAMHTRYIAYSIHAMHTLHIAGSSSTFCNLLSTECAQCCVHEQHWLTLADVTAGGSRLPLGECGYNLIK